MAVTEVTGAQTGNGETGTSSSVSITIPATAAVGDYVLVHVLGNKTSSVITPPSGWSPVSGPDDIGTSDVGWVYAKTLVTGDPGSTVTFSLSVTGRYEAVCIVTRGGTASGVLVASSTSTNGSTTSTLPSLASVPAGALLVAFMSGVTNSTTAPSFSAAGYTNETAAAVATAFTTAPNLGSQGAYKTASTAGTYGGDTVTAVGGNPTSLNYLIAVPGGTVVSVSAPSGIAAGLQPTAATPTLQQPAASGLVGSRGEASAVNRTLSAPSGFAGERAAAPTPTVATTPVGGGVGVYADPPQTLHNDANISVSSGAVGAHPGVAVATNAWPVSAGAVGVYEQAASHIGNTTLQVTPACVGEQATAPGLTVSALNLTVDVPPAFVLARGAAHGTASTALTQLTRYYFRLDGTLGRWMRGATTPSAPTSVALGTVGTTSAVLNWAAPATDGGSPITGYQVSRDGAGGSTTTVGASTTSFTFTGLTTSTTYNLTVAAVNAIGVGPSQTVSVTTGVGTVSTSRFPGDTNPKVTGQWYWGDDERDTDPSVQTVTYGEAGAPEAMAGGIPVGAQRNYYTSWAAITPNNGAALTWALGQLAKGRIPWVSVFCDSTNACAQTWAQAADGRNATLWLNFITWVEEVCTGPFWFTICHEPRDNAGSASCGSPADFADMNAAFRAAMDTYANAHGGVGVYKWKNLAFGPIFTDTTYQATDSKSIGPFMTKNDGTTLPHRTYDFMGVDTYVVIGGTNPDPPYWTAAWQASLTWLENPAHSWPVCIGEYAVRNSYANGATKMQQFYNRCLDGTHDIVACCYYNTSLASPPSSGLWLLTNNSNGGMLDMYVSLMKDARSVHYYNFGWSKPAGIP